jgi:hypothetical protein
MQPMGIGEVLDAAITLYRTQWKALLPIAALLVVPATFLQLYLTRGLGSPLTTTPTPVTPEELEGTFIAAGIISLIQFLFIDPLLTASVARVAAQGYLGHRVEVGPTLGFAIRRVHSILWISLLTGLAILLGLIVVIVGAIIAWVRLSFAPAVLVIEGTKGSKTLSRSWQLSLGNFWRLFGTLLLAAILTGVVSSVLVLPASAIHAAIGPAGWPIGALGQSLASVLTLPFTTLITVVLYFDLRIRKEAFDLQVMARDLAAGS